MRHGRVITDTPYSLKEDAAMTYLKMYLEGPTD
jgi:hypothetical protein